MEDYLAISSIIHIFILIITNYCLISFILLIFKKVLAMHLIDYLQVVLFFIILLLISFIV
jgi:hypothetical protein